MGLVLGYLALYIGTAPSGADAGARVSDTHRICWRSAALRTRLLRRDGARIANDSGHRRQHFSLTRRRDWHPPVRAFASISGTLAR